MNMSEYNRRRRERDGVSATTQYKRKARGVDPLALVDCSICGQPLKVVRGERVATPAHKTCKDTSAFYVKKSERLAIYDRDGWSCQICHLPVQPDSYYLSDWYPTLDHIVPQSEGGGESLDNLRCVHRFCNLSRSNRPIEYGATVRAKAISKYIGEVRSGRKEATAASPGGGT